MKILWKEWQQQKWLFVIGCLAGIIFPACECLYVWSRNHYFRTDIGGGIVAAFGAIFAIILAAATTHHDTKDGTDTFLKSKPIKIWKIFAVKFFVAAILLFTTFLFIISLDLITHPRDIMSFIAWQIFCYTYPIALLLFAVTMFLVVIVRDTARAVLLAIWAGLLIYFLPLLVGRLEWMNIFEQIDNANQRPSLIQFVVWKFSLPAGLHSGTYRPANIPVSYYDVGLAKGLWQILTSQAYQQYLLFLGVTTVGAIVFTVLSIKAMGKNWRWQPGQKTIAWTIGLSAAFIFGVAMTQAGNNLEPVKEWNGKSLINPAEFDWRNMPASLQEGLPKGQIITWDQQYFDRYSDAACVKDDLMFRISRGYQRKRNEKKSNLNWNKEVIRHFVLQIYRFPYSENNSTDAGVKKTQNFVVGAMRFFSTEPVHRYGSRGVIGCFIKNNYLYVVYRPEKNKQGRYDMENMPIYFATVDISTPEKPQLISNIEFGPTRYNCDGFANYGDYCYLNHGEELMIISVKQPEKPEIIKKISYANLFDIDMENRPLPWNDFLVSDNKMLCRNNTQVSILDLAEPTEPKVIYDESFAKPQFPEGQKIRSAAYRDGLIYISTKDGLYVRKLVKQADGKFKSEPVGERLATPIEKFAGRNPVELLFYKGYLIEASSGFGLIVYDVSNPERPKRVYHAGAGNTSDVGIWNDLIYTQDYGFGVHFFDIPKN